MTQEEKARAYDEALEVMRQWIAPCHTKEQLDTLKKSVFPELAESEDERIRRTLIHIVKGACDKYGIKYKGDITQEQMLAYLEKQKERGPLTKEEEYTLHRIIEYLEDEICPSEWVNLLHDIYCLPYQKQKENSKTADFIPSNCVSDAKCEDRWHKVEDSLPDNGREVLAKDKLGNTLLARYDGEGWDVSVYDDEDYRCHNGISKWCEIPFEKQKEQKPAEWSEDSVKFEEGFKAGRESGLRDGQKYVLNNLDSYGLCKLAEWSEEDKLPRYYGD